jgi:hypothetical protein
VSPGDWVRRRACGPLSASFQAVAYHPPTVSHPLLQTLFTESSWAVQVLAPPSLLQCAQSNPPSLLHVHFSSLFIIQFFLWGVGQSSRGLGWFIPGELWEYCVPLIYSHVGLQLPSRFGVNVWWCGSPPIFSV